MKKEYIHPAMQVVMIQQARMLCASPTDLDADTLDVLPDDKDDVQDIEDIW